MTRPELLKVIKHGESQMVSLKSLRTKPSTLARASRRGIVKRKPVMTKEQFRKLITQGEGQRLEFKESLQLKDEIGETASAFSNSKGGTILIGIGDKSEILGVNIGKKTIEDLANYIKTNTDPPVFPSVLIEEVEDKNFSCR